MPLASRLFLFVARAAPILLKLVANRCDRGRLSRTKIGVVSLASRTVSMIQPKDATSCRQNGCSGGIFTCTTGLC